MSSTSLKVILELLGTLDDSSGEDTARGRFLNFLKGSVVEVGQVRDYIDECLRLSAAEKDKRTHTRFNRALQDLVTHAGQFLGFKEVEFGRYMGVPGQIGYDGLWRSASGFAIVLEVKTSESHPIKTASLLNYMNDLISEKKISSSNDALGLYVVGRPDPEVRQIEKNILAEKNSDRLRIISVESLLSLAELKEEYELDDEKILELLRPTPRIDPAVDIMKGLIAEPAELPQASPTIPSEAGEASYWLSPVKSYEAQSAEGEIKELVGEHKVFAFGERTPGRKDLKPDDWICFYASAIGVVAHAKVLTKPEKKAHPKVRHPEEYPYSFALSGPQLYIQNPVVIDAALRNQLEAFRDRDPNQAWGWFVIGTRRISKHDFELLTRSKTNV